MFLKEIVAEKADAKKRTTVFVETDPQYPFPDNTIKAIHKEINSKAKDLSLQWKNAVELVKAAFIECKVPMPPAYLAQRWGQYLDLLRVAVQALADARGFKGSWRMS